MKYLIFDLLNMPKGHVVEAESEEAALVIARPLLTDPNKYAVRDFCKTERGAAFDGECDHLLLQVLAYREEMEFCRERGLLSQADVAEQKMKNFRAEWIAKRTRIRERLPDDSELTFTQVPIRG